MAGAAAPASRARGRVRVEVVDQARTRDLRRAVLRPNLGVDDPLPGDELADAIHIAALDGDTVIGTCFVYPAPCPWRPGEHPSWRLRQMATAPERRRAGIGSAVVAAAIEAVAASGGGTLWLEAREPAVPLYARHGFVREGAIYVDEQHPTPHQRMWQPVKSR
jgi:GNAT superfamily N-acetyltransferase